MPKFAKSYEFDDIKTVPKIDGEDFPWYVSTVGPLVEADPTTDGVTHILWVPVMVDGPLPTPPEGHPSGEALVTALS